jgi:hypothetical protein
MLQLHKMLSEPLHQGTYIGIGGKSTLEMNTLRGTRKKRETTLRGFDYRNQGT